MTAKPKVTPEGKCSNCGGTDMVLAQDQTQYTSFTMVDGGWRDDGSRTEDMESDDPLGNVRFFCTACGTYHEVPEAVQPNPFAVQ